MKYFGAFACIGLSVAVAVACGDSADSTASNVGTGGGHKGGSGGAGADSGTGGSGACPSNLLCGAKSACCAVGEECVEAACVPACASGVRCGSDNKTCCNAGEVCANAACAVPGEDCYDSVDCNAGEFCEPTIGKCLPQGAGPTCTYKKPAKPFSPVLKWSFTDSTALPGYNQAVSAPLVVHTDKTRAPEVYFTVAAESQLTQSAGGVLMSLDGATGTERWAAGVDAFKPENAVETSFSPALADIDGDGKVEIVTVTTAHQLIAFDSDGKLKWKSHKSDNSDFLFPGYPTFYPSTVSIADMDADGKGEVALSGVVFDSTGTLVSGLGKELGGGPVDATYNPTSSIIADVDGDKKQELVLGNGAYRLDGSPVWENGQDDGFPAIADFEKDGTPELVVVTWTGLRVQNAKTGAVLATLDLGGSFPGTPVIADFDGDGTPNIGVTGGYNGCAMRAFEYDAVGGISQMWSRPLVACSGFLTSTAFDFEGDGKVEVLAHDDCYFYILNGSTGDVLLRVPASHATWTEFVSVADIDGDKSADLLFSTNDHWNGALANWGVCGYTGTDAPRHGVFVYSDPDHAWMPTRQVWNQQSYHITNIKAKGTLPKGEPDSWGPLGFNNYRVSYQGAGVDNAPDLAVDLEVSTKSCPTSLVLRAHVKNIGSLGVAPGVKVSFYLGQPPTGTSLGDATTQNPLSPGQSEIVELTTPIPTTPAPYYFFVVVDGDSAIAECDETNNTAAIGGVSCSLVK